MEEMHHGVAEEEVVMVVEPPQTGRPDDINGVGSKPSRVMNDGYKSEPEVYLDKSTDDILEMDVYFENDESKKPGIKLRWSLSMGNDLRIEDLDIPKLVNDVIDKLGNHEKDEILLSGLISPTLKSTTRDHHDQEDDIVVTIEARRRVRMVRPTEHSHRPYKKPAAVDLFRCLSCFSIFLPFGRGRVDNSEVEFVNEEDCSLDSSTGVLLYSSSSSDTLLNERPSPDRKTGDQESVSYKQETSEYSLKPGDYPAITSAPAILPSGDVIIDGGLQTGIDHQVKDDEGESNVVEDRMDGFSSSQITRINVRFMKKGRHGPVYVYCR